MYQLVHEISQFKVIFPPHKDAAIFLILSLVPIKKKSSMTSQPHYRKLWRNRKCNIKISSNWICLKFCNFIEFVRTIRLWFKIRCHGNQNENNGLLLNSQKPIVYTNVLTIFQLETTQFTLYLIFYEVKLVLNIYCRLTIGFVISNKRLLFSF